MVKFSSTPCPTTELRKTSPKWPASWQPLRKREKRHRQRQGNRGPFMFEVSVDATFAAAHSLRGYQGKCENLHGHNYRVRLTVAGKELDKIGLLQDFTVLKRVLRGVVNQLDHQ